MLLHIDKLINNAIGLATGADTKKVFVPFALPHEDIIVKEELKKKDYTEASILEIVNKAEERIEAICPHYGVCGGCNFLHVSPKDSAKFKTDIVKDNLERVAKLQTLPEILEPAFTENLRYRSRAKIHVSLNERKVGFLSINSNDLIDIDNCPLLDEKLNYFLENKDETIKLAKKRMLEVGISKKTGLIEIQLFCGDDKASIGNDDVVITVDGYKFTVNANVFFQSNLLVLPELFKFIKEEAKGDTIMDLYSGVGTFSTLFEGSGKKVIAVERQKECLRLAKKNAPSAESYTDSVESWAKKRKDKVDTVIVDPPRVGLDRTAISEILRFDADRIIYISCNSVTLSRDLQLFSGYELKKLQVLDFYYGSGHTECVCLMTRKG